MSNNSEIRSYGEDAAPKLFEQDDVRTVRGYAIVFNRESQVLYDRQARKYFVEIIEPVAATKDYLDSQDIKLNREHDDGRLLARSRYGMGSLRYGVDEYGVWYETDLPKTSEGKDTYALLMRGDLFGSSFRFAYAEGGYTDEVKGGLIYRKVKQFAGIYDFSIVADPAYLATSADARSMDSLLTPQEPEQPEVRERPAYINDALNSINSIINNID